MQKKEYSLTINGKNLTAIFTDLADQANGSVLVSYGETTVLATAVMSQNRREGIDFFPLVVDYEEKFYAAGRILGGRFIKREGRPSDEAVLTGRAVDRTIRPLFDQHIRNEVQVVITVLSFDQKNDPDVPAIIAASLALGTSDIPWNGPVSAIRIGQRQAGGEFIINPEYEELANIPLDLLICGQDGKINMIEAEAKEIPEATAVAAFKLAAEKIAIIQTWQEKIIKAIGRVKQVIEKPKPLEETIKLFAKNIAPKLESSVFSGPGKKKAEALAEEWLTLFQTEFPGTNTELAVEYFDQVVSDLIHQKAIKNSQRADGRKLDEVRPLFAKAGGLSNIVHGTGIFYRGGTHILTTLTLSGPKDSQLVEGMEVQEKRYFMHHYNFPPFSTGETGRLGGMNRRAIGHGALVEKSLKAVLPDRSTFPYTIRLVSEAMASNGSTSMGSVCASTLALMDGGVPITRPVAGIAIGLVINKADEYKILTDIQGPEDHHGDMDFKVAGTEIGLTGLQLDVKVNGVSIPILAEALSAAKKARLEILAVMTGAIPKPRPEIKESAPKIIQLTIPTDKIGAVIGPGGKIIQQIIAATGAEIEIEDDGTVYVTGQKDGVARAKKIIGEITREYKPGDKFDGQVTRLMDFGVFVKIGYDQEGLVHISELAPWRVEKVTDLVKEGDKVPVTIKEIDDKGRINLSIKRANDKFFERKRPES